MHAMISVMRFTSPMRSSRVLAVSIALKYIRPQVFRGKSVNLRVGFLHVVDRPLGMLTRWTSSSESQYSHMTNPRNSPIMKFILRNRKVSVLCQDSAITYLRTREMRLETQRNTKTIEGPVDNGFSMKNMQMRIV